MSIALKKILVATDGSKDAALAVWAAIDLCNETGAELHVIHAWRNMQPASLPAVASEEYWRARERYEREAIARRIFSDSVRQPLASPGSPKRSASLASRSRATWQRAAE